MFLFTFFITSSYLAQNSEFDQKVFDNAWIAVFRDKGAKICVEESEYCITTEYLLSLVDDWMLILEIDSRHDVHINCCLYLKRFE